MEREGRSIRLSVLDQSPIRSGGTAHQAIAETLALAQAAERLGYHRYWLAEHHSSEGLAGTAPEILVARIAAATERMRIGTGGVMLSHYSALKVAETFRVRARTRSGRSTTSRRSKI
jgi:luciferase family oxidoreductase group 1